MKQALARLFFGALALGGLFAVFCVGYALTDLNAWEWPALYRSLGTGGVAFVVLGISGLLVATALLVRIAVGRPRLGRTARVAVAAFLGTWALCIVWLGDWLFVETPFTMRAAQMLRTPAPADVVIERAVAHARRDGSLAALKALAPRADERRLAIMLARVEANRPYSFGDVPLGVTIARYAKRYEVSPVLLTYWTFIDSWYGEAPLGPMPMFRQLNGETFRDLVQAHLPSWLIESRVRQWLIEGPLFPRFPGGLMGTKLRYAVQKATYDIAISPYMNSVYSDLFVILKEYPQEFPELFGPGAAPDPLAASFLELRDHVMLPPYDSPYARPPESPEFYARHREALKAFPRAAVYRLIDDYEFATKVQALVARYYADQYAKRLPPGAWARLTEQQQTVLLALLRDVYTPNIGRLSSNLYLVPEFNCTPITAMATEFNADGPETWDPKRIWLPGHQERFWGATGLMLRTLNETWNVMSGEWLPGVKPNDSVTDAIAVLAFHEQVR